MTTHINLAEWKKQFIESLFKNGHVHTQEEAEKLWDAAQKIARKHLKRTRR